MSIPKKLRKATSWKGFPLSVVADREVNGTKPRSISFVSDNMIGCFHHVFDEIDFNENECIFMHSKFTWANVAGIIGLFESVGIARKSGWNVPIESGFSEAIFFLSDGTPIFVFIWKDF